MPSSHVRIVVFDGDELRIKGLHQCEWTNLRVSSAQGVFSVKLQPCLLFRRKAFVALPKHGAMDNLLSVYRHPALTVLIDDSQSYLDSIAFQLDPLLACKSFYDPLAAIGWLRNAYRQSVENDPIHVGYDEENDSFERRRAFIDLDLIYHVVMNRKRFDLPTVVVVDYVMPMMNGVAFCEAIRDLPCKKILLTGQADEGVAIDAFNRKLIDLFIKKNAPDAMTQLEAGIIRLQKAFFTERTRTLADLLSRHSYSFLSDPAMSVLVGELCKQYRFVEYYLFPNPEGILFLDSQGRATLMVVATRTSLTAQFEIAQDQDAPPELLAALRELRLVAFFSDTGGTYLDTIGDDWLQYCLPPQVCRGRQDYYWGLFDFPPAYLPSPVFPFDAFLKKQTGGSAGYFPLG